MPDPWLSLTITAAAFVSTTPGLSPDFADAGGSRVRLGETCEIGGPGVGELGAPG